MNEKSITQKSIEKRTEKAHFHAAIKSLIIKIVVVGAFIAIVFTCVFGISLQNGEDMYPRVRDGDVMLYFRHSTKVENGDIITFRNDGKRFTGRIVAHDGDIVDFSADGKLVVNGSVQYEEIYYDTYAQGSSVTFPYEVGDNSVFILGDMRTGATDSRDFGAVEFDKIDGKVIAILRRRGI